MLPESFTAYLTQFSFCFTEPTYRRFLTIVAGWVLCTGRRTVTGVIRAAGVVGERHHSGYHRFFSQARWSLDPVGLTLLRLLLSLLPKQSLVMLTVDDTLARHTGKHIASGAMHRDPLLSTGKKPYFHFGHNWVVVSLVFIYGDWDKVFSLPVLVRLYRTEKLNKKMGLKHRKKTDLADEMIQLLAQAHPKRQLLVIGDNAYCNRSIVRPLPDNVHFLGRGRMDAALYAPPPKSCGRGRPRVKGERLRSPTERAQSGRWRKVKVRIYGREATVQVQVFNALWYIVGHSRLMRFFLIRGWPGHDKDDVLATTDLSMTIEQAVVQYCCRWSEEETFGWVKSRLGFEDPQNRTEKAVQRTAPMALLVYSLVVYWYVNWTKRRRWVHVRVAPWYTTKKAPSFSDMLATLRRESWTLWISDQASNDRLDQKDLAPLLDAVGYS
jgi:hypothetical protein